MFQTINQPKIFDGFFSRPRLSQEPRPLSPSEIVDAVVTTRVQFSHKSGLNLSALFENGIAFFAKNFECHLFTPPSYPAKLYVRSWTDSGLEDDRRGTRVNVHFEITDEDSSVTLAKGNAHWVIVNAKLGRATVLPKEVWKYFCEDQNIFKVGTKNQLPFLEETAPAESVSRSLALSDHVREDDIDYNQHMTSAAYLRHLDRTLQRLENETGEKLGVSAFSAHFARSLKLGDSFTQRLDFYPSGQLQTRFLTEASSTAPCFRAHYRLKPARKSFVN